MTADLALDTETLDTIRARVRAAMTELDAAVCGQACDPLEWERACLKAGFALVEADQLLRGQPITPTPRIA